MPVPSRYLSDASHFKGEADRLYRPSQEKEIAEILRRAHQEKKPVTIAGAGTGLTGARVPAGGIVLSVERMNKILDIQWDRKRRTGRASVQPGVPLKALQEALDKEGLFYPPDPGETRAFLGGTLSTNASGPRTFLYGPTRPWVSGFRLVLASGETLSCRRGRIRASGGFLRIPLSSQKALRVPVPTYSTPKVKNAAGYFAHPHMDLVDLFIGSEGTLGVFSEIELIALKSPPLVLSGILFFKKEKECFLFMQEARARGNPRALEFFDRRSLLLLSRIYPELPREARSALYFEEECVAARVPQLRTWWGGSAKAGVIPFLSWISKRGQEHRFFRKIRYHLPCLVNEEVKKRGFRKIGTDMAVPDEHAERMFDLYLKILGASGIDYTLFGHIGNNHLHANLLPKTEAQFEKAQEIYRTLAKEAVRLKGTISAEHGIGKVRIPYLELMVGKKGLREMARVKRLLDPNGILNPGNIIPAEMLGRA